MTKQDYAIMLINTLGGTTATAKHFSLSDRRIADNWRKRGVPAKFARTASEITGIGIEKFILGD